MNLPYCITIKQKADLQSHIHIYEAVLGSKDSKLILPTRTNSSKLIDKLLLDHN
eukprot:Pgem_evm1s6781